MIAARGKVNYAISLYCGVTRQKTRSEIELARGNNTPLVCGELCRRILLERRLEVFFLLACHSACLVLYIFKLAHDLWSTEKLCFDYRKNILFL